MGIIAVQCEVTVTGDDLYHPDIIFEHWPVLHVSLSSFLIALVRHHVVLSLTQYSHSCSIHYHRIHPVYWKDRLQRVQAMGLNTIEVRHAADSASRHQMPMPYQMLRTLQFIPRS